MKKFVVIIFITIIISFISCDEGTVGPTHSSTYSYTSYDTKGNTIVKGWLIMDYQDSSQITGEWNFEKIGNPKDIGPQVGSGKLVGSLEPDRVLVELNPQYKDNNLLLSGTIKDNNYSGVWQWISFTGITNHGTFEAIKN